MIGAGVITLMCFGVLVYIYELHCRGPSESAFFGLWETDGYMSDDPCYYIEFKADQTLSISVSPTMNEEQVLMRGRWYAGGSNIYVRVPTYWSNEGNRPLVFQIIDITPDEFRVLFRDSYVQVFRRVHPTMRRS
jgi:hypothetical protein